MKYFPYQKATHSYEIHSNSVNYTHTPRSINTVSIMDAVRFSETKIGNLSWNFVSPKKKKYWNCGHIEETIYLLFLTKNCSNRALNLFFSSNGGKNRVKWHRNNKCEMVDLCNAHYAFIMNMPLFTISNCDFTRMCECGAHTETPAFNTHKHNENVFPLGLIYSHFTTLRFVWNGHNLMGYGHYTQVDSMNLYLFKEKIIVHSRLKNLHYLFIIFVMPINHRNISLYSTQKQWENSLKWRREKSLSKYEQHVVCVPEKPLFAHVPRMSLSHTHITRN